MEWYGGSVRILFVQSIGLLWLATQEVTGTYLSNATLISKLSIVPFRTLKT